MLILLRVYSEFSLLKSTIKPEEAINYCLENKLHSIGLANANSMFGTFDWSLKLQKHKIKPIIGSCLKVENGEVWVFCKNKNGYKELNNLLTYSNVEKNGKLNISDIALKECLLLCDNSLSIDQLLKLKEKNDLNIAISRQKRDEISENSLLQFSANYSLPIIAAPKCFYAKKEQALNADCLWCIRNNTYLSQEDRETINEDEYFKSQKEYEKDFEDIPWAIDNAEIFAKKCNFLTKESAPIMPHLDILNPKEEFEKNARNGLKMRLEKNILPNYLKKDHQEIINKYTKQVEHEINTIIELNFAEYFLIVSDFVKWAKNNDIPVGPGRGSGASSAVAWCLEITNLDPIKFNLMFERFLNPERVSLPDFDIDFCQENRHKVIEYLQKKYGKDHVSMILTFGSLQYRSALRDIGRVLQMPYSLVDQLCKKLPPPIQGVNPTLKELREKKISTEFICSENEELFKVAEEVEGLPRHASTHAAGVIISHKKLSDIVALTKEENSEIPIIQCNLKDAEKIGLVKFDILGLTVLSTIKKTINLIKEKGIELDLEIIPLNDPNVFKMLQNGFVKAVFQIDSIGFRNLMIEMKPTCFEDLIAAGALYRPGPMADIPKFVKCKNGEEKSIYPYPEMESILKETYGVIVYQEQILQIAKEVAGYSLQEADLLRRAVGKKIKSEMQKHERKFIEGTLANHPNSEKKAEILFENLARFASYGFPKAHAAPYGLMTYQTAYLKCNYTIEFLCATMFYEQNLEKIEEVIQEGKKLGITSLPPCINNSEVNFSIKNNKILFGLSKIKGLGEIAKEIIKQRNNEGNFSCIKNLIKRVPNINKKALEGLVFSGAFDCFNNNRAKLFDEINNKKTNNNLMLFDFEEENKWSNLELIKKEISVLESLFNTTIFTNVNLKKLNIHKKLDAITKKGNLFCLGWSPIIKRTKEGKIINAYEFFDELGRQKLFTNIPIEIENEETILEIEKFPNRYLIKNAYKINDFFGKYKKVFLENVSYNLKLKNILESGPTSIYILENDIPKLIGDFQLTHQFFDQFEKNIIYIK